MHLAGTDSFIIVNAVIFDGHDVLDADTVVVQDGVLTGLRTGVVSDLSDELKVIDARGGLVTPGFVDAHVHPVFAGIEALSLDLSSCDTVDDTLARIRRALDAETESVD